jgi:hypothetical protein
VGKSEKKQDDERLEEVKHTLYEFKRILDSHGIDADEERDEEKEEKKKKEETPEEK